MVGATAAIVPGTILPVRGRIVATRAQINFLGKLSIEVTTRNWKTVNKLVGTSFEEDRQIKAKSLGS